MTILSKARCMVCGAIIWLDLNGDWHCPVCGAYDGNGHIEWLEEEYTFYGNGQKVLLDKAERQLYDI